MICDREFSLDFLPAIFTDIICNSSRDTSCRFYDLFFIIMFCQWNFFCFCLATTAASICLYTFFCTGCFFCYNSFIPRMSKSGFGFYLLFSFTKTMSTRISCDFWIFTRLYLSDFSIIPRMSYSLYKHPLFLQEYTVVAGFSHVAPL